MNLDFTKAAPGTLLDGQGRGIGLTHRLPGTGSALLERDANLNLSPERRALELTTTRSDLNTQDRMPTGEYLGFRLADLGFTGKEDFEISASIPNIPGLKVVGQFGVYAGSRSNKNIRGGLIRRPDPDSYRLFLVNNADGNDTDIYEIGLMTTGDDLRLTLRRLERPLLASGRQRDAEQLEHAGNRPPGFPGCGERSPRRSLRGQHPERSPRDADDPRSEGHRLDDPAPKPHNGGGRHPQLKVP